jgi:hypothetical protein
MAKRDTFRDLFYRLWFARTTQEITIVAPPSFDGLKDAELTSTNYAQMDRIGDRDSVYAIGKLLSRRYPRSTLHLTCSEDFTAQGLRKNFVILGGPGGTRLSSEGSGVEPVEGNEACRVFMRRAQSAISYSADCESMLIGGSERRASYDNCRHMIQDYGAYSAFQNPFHQASRIVMIHGIHTLGVLGAARAFDGEPDSRQNYDRLLEFFGSVDLIGSTAFECAFEVAVLNGEVECPALDRSHLRRLTVRRIPADGGGSIHETQRVDTAEQLLWNTVNLIKIAEAGALEAKRRSLEALRNAVQGVPFENTDLITELSDTASQNDRFPEDNIRRMLALIKDAG